MPALNQRFRLIANLIFVAKKLPELFGTLRKFDKYVKGTADDNASDYASIASQLTFHDDVTYEMNGM